MANPSKNSAALFHTDPLRENFKFDSSEPPIEPISNLANSENLKTLDPRIQVLKYHCR